MQQNYETSKFPTTASESPSGGGAEWSDPDNILADDGNTSDLAYFSGGDSGASITGDDFDFNLPPNAVIDGIAVTIEGSQTGCYGTVGIGITDSDTKDMETLNKTYGDNSDLWGLDEISLEDLADLAITVDTGDVSGGDGVASIDFVQITIFWHVDLSVAPADVPTRVLHKVYSRDGDYLGELPNAGPVAFSQDLNSAGSMMELTCAIFADNTTVTNELQTEDEEDLLTENELEILATLTNIVIAEGSSVDKAIFKNSNRVKTYIYNYWYPNGKIIFSGQINKVGFQYGGNDSGVKLNIYSDGLDLDNFIARGYPFAYTTDVTQNSQNGYVTVTEDGGKGAGWNRYGQTWQTGGGVENVGAITLKLKGTATVTLSIYDAPNGNFLGSATKNVSLGSATDTQFEFPQLIEVSESTSYFMAVSVASGQSIRVYRHSTSSTYANGSMYQSLYAGGSGGGSWSAVSGDFYFITKYGSPTTTTTYSTDDPVSEMMSGILADYNARGGYVTERDFEATGLSLTYQFNQASIFDALKKILELSPSGYYSFVDLGTAEMDVLPTSENADFTVIKGRDVNQLNLAMSIEQVKNYLLFTGGDTGGGTNLFKQYQNSESAALFGTRMEAKTDNRVTLDATANAVGDTFIEENAEELQETTVTVLNKTMDITQLIPGKTIGFRNFNAFIDAMVLQIVRRDYTTEAVTLTLGRLPVTMNAEIQRINRELLEEQTAANPTAPS